MTEPQKRWAEFGYEPVRGLMNRHISRHLRTQRKNMRRFFEERGLFTLVERMNQIRKSRQGMLEKNRMFQGVLNEYQKLVTPTVRSGGVEGVPSPAEPGPHEPAAAPQVPGTVPGSVLREPSPAIAGETEATDQ